MKKRQKSEIRIVEKKLLISLQQLEKIQKEMSILRSLTHRNIYRYVPERPGIYAIWYRHRVLYVGKSNTSIRRRLSEHQSQSENSPRLVQIWVACKGSTLFFSMCDISSLLGEDMDILTKYISLCETYFIRQWRTECNLKA